MKFVFTIPTYIYIYTYATRVHCSSNEKIKTSSLMGHNNFMLYCPGYGARVQRLNETAAEQ